MTKEERVLAVLQGRPVDRIPVSFWWPYPEVDENPRLLAEAIVQDHREYDLDFIKMMPSGMYGVEDWGWEVGDPELAEPHRISTGKGAIRRAASLGAASPRRAV